MLPEEPIAFDDDGYDPALSSDQRDKLQVDYEREWRAAQEIARRLQRALDVHTAVTASRGEGSAPSNHSRQHLDDGVRAVNASLAILDRLKAQLLRAASPPARAGAYARRSHPDVAPLPTSRELLPQAATLRPHPTPAWTAVPAMLH